MLSVLIYVAVVVLRAFTGDGDAERKFAAALGVLGTVNLPIIHYSVRKWGGIHPTVITKGGGGLEHPDMRSALFMGFVAMTLLAMLLLLMRARLAIARARVARAEEHSATLGLLDDED
jgi:heme exporter protein C